MASLKLTCPRTLVKHLGGLAGDVLNLKLKNNLNVILVLQYSRNVCIVFL